MQRLLTYWRAIWHNLWLINLIWVGGVLLIGLAAALVAQLPPGDAFIFPLKRFAYGWGELFYVPVAVVLIVTIVLTWPMLIQWGISRGDTVPEVQTPNLRLLFALMIVSGGAFTAFGSVDRSEQLDAARSDSHSYVLLAEEYPTRSPWLILHECDRDRFICEPIVDEQSSRWNMRMTLDVQGETVRIMNLRTVVFSHTPED